MSETTPTPPEPVFRVARGNPTPEELAALTVVVMAAAQNGSAQTTRERHSRGWSSRRRMMPNWAGRSGWGAF